MKTKILMLTAALIALFAGLVLLVPNGYLSVQSKMKWFLLTEAEPIAIHAGPFLSIFFFDKNNGIAVGSISIEKTNDGGTNWSAVKNWDENNRGFSSILSANGQLWIVGSEKDKPLVLTTKTHGFNWEDWKHVVFEEKNLSELNSKFTSFYDMCFDHSGNAWAVGDGGVAQLTPSDKEWQVSSIFVSKDRLNSVSCNPSGQVWAVGENSTALRYQNGWEKIETGKVGVFTKVISYDKETWILGGESTSKVNSLRKGVLVRSRDNGQTWENKGPESASVLHDININGKSGWLVGDDGSLYSTGNSGDSWNKEVSPTQNDLLNIFFLDSQNIWAVGDRGSVLKYQSSSASLPDRHKVW